MGHESEATFHEKVHDHLIDLYGQDNVESEYYLEETYRFADFWVDTGIIILAIEIEDNFDGVVKGIGQAQLYAQHHPRAIPVVIVPEGHVDEPEGEYFRNGTPVVELDL